MLRKQTVALLAATALCSVAFAP
ncbi:hypothetical protein MNBD_ALPHA02-2050, partial [hydrothermal vent metagenome]